MIESSVVEPGGGGGVTVMVAARAVPLYVAEICEVSVAVTALVDTVAT